MSDMFNQSASTGGEQHSQPHDKGASGVEAGPPPLGETASAEASTGAISGDDRSTEAKLAPILARLTNSSATEEVAFPPMPPHVDRPISAIPQEPSFIKFGIKIRPDAAEADLDKLAAGLGRPKTNAAAENLTGKWSGFIEGLRNRRVPFDKILELMLAGPDQEAFNAAFTDNAVVTPKTLRKFRTLVAAARTSVGARTRADGGAP